jgi:hypothetical protein
MAKNLLKGDPLYMELKVENWSPREQHNTTQSNCPFKRKAGYSLLGLLAVFSWFTIRAELFFFKKQTDVYKGYRR